MYEVLKDNHEKSNVDLITNKEENAKQINKDETNGKHSYIRLLKS